ncbi:hypothetical protein B0H63DRAFT_473280 [Podospora didyma]|uniref:Uncharacterized protein n=1 Tax=Podospora didyma TaxID=330526 RepID=A0AAE0TZQ9_9PEZI|nr:hypothetical protein B0H63DRAFT_473280 [Podospora didyma]
MTTLSPESIVALVALFARLPPTCLVLLRCYRRSLAHRVRFDEEQTLIALPFRQPSDSSRRRAHRVPSTGSGRVALVLSLLFEPE